MDNETKKKEIMKKVMANKGKGGPGSGGVGQYAIDDPTKAEANLDSGMYAGKGGPGMSGKCPKCGKDYADCMCSKDGKGGPGDMQMAEEKGSPMGGIKKKMGPIVKSAGKALSPSRFPSLNSASSMQQVKPAQVANSFEKKKILKNSLQSMPLKTRQPDMTPLKTTLPAMKPKEMPVERKRYA